MDKPIGDVAEIEQALGMSLESLEGVSGRLLLTCAEAAEVLRVSRSKLYDLIRRGEVVSVMIGGSRRVPREGLARYLRLLTEQGTAAADERRDQWRVPARPEWSDGGRRGQSLPG